MSNLNIFLVRHAQSEGNVDKKVHLSKADHAIELTEIGKKQAKIAANKIEEFISYRSRVFEEESFLKPKRIWISPYKRTRQTAEIIYQELYEKFNRNVTKIEDVALCEQQFGLFDGLSSEELAIKFPNEHQHYEKLSSFQGRFWARMPLGESRFDVTQRVRTVKGTWFRDLKKHDIKNLIIVSHGVTLRAIKMDFLHKTPEWFEEEKNPGNASVELIRSGSYNSEVIFGGFDENNEIIL